MFQILLFLAEVTVTLIVVIALLKYFVIDRKRFKHDEIGGSTTRKYAFADLRNYRTLILGISFFITVGYAWAYVNSGRWEDDYIALLKEPVVIEEEMQEEVDITQQSDPPKPKIQTVQIEEVTVEEIIEEEIELTDPEEETEDLPDDPGDEEGEEDDDEGDGDDDIVDEPLFYASQMPEFGDGDVNGYISRELRKLVTSRDIERGISGTVQVKFIVEKDGSISNAEIVRGLPSQSLNEKALKVIRDMPSWKPAKNNGFPARVILIKPISFNFK